MHLREIDVLCTRASYERAYNIVYIREKRFIVYTYIPRVRAKTLTLLDESILLLAFEIEKCEEHHKFSEKNIYAYIHLLYTSSREVHFHF